MTPEKPAQGIMQTNAWSDAESHVIACDCHHNDHNVIMWVEVADQSDTQHVTLTFFVKTYLSNRFNRVRTAWRVLWSGELTQEHELILNSQTALNVSEAIAQAVSRLEKSIES